ncbi:protein-tyrosine phosphatase-like protein [Talaromyces proteolyticus]|uniref:phosphatidylinositol-3,4,5-trisphosphate 3-phosphatase n=1 Tax=Talaromyces proteolyticus TaxID=1131652 RepID=A0AAD4Q6X3_9EURO|nr:protein-tyrosine phosphatase-like protein [Talaromyces proteolyticus]KAH8705762.1 protein-tyrosine phosphatase-like protein [Talaromyces proteolyticus]
MASLLRQIVAGPRLQHPETGLDLCYVTDSLIATSGPSSTYPQRAYRNPTDALVRFLDLKHGADWAIWEFRAEGTGYPDSEVYGRIHHFPFPDHHPPPFALIPPIMASMRNWLAGDADKTKEKRQQDGSSKGTGRVAVVHCKAGKGRSGTVSCSYLISQEGWKMEDAMQRFTERRMRVGFGEGVSIASQVRWIGYVNRWTNKMRKVYVERPVEILEVHVWGLRDGVKIAVEGFVEEGRRIKCFHLFKKKERIIIDKGSSDNSPDRRDENHVAGKGSIRQGVPPLSSSIHQSVRETETVTSPAPGSPKEETTPISAAILRPQKPVIVPTSDVNIDLERRSKAAYTGWAMVTSIAHVWFNAYFEGGDEHESGVFECEWDKLDGIKGTTRKGTRALERLKVVWRYASKDQLEGKPRQQGEHQEIQSQVIKLPEPGEPVHESHAADWRGDNFVRENDADEQDFEQTGVGNPTSAPGSHIETKGLKGANHPLPTEVTIAAATAVSSAAHKVAHLGKELGLRQQTDASNDVSLASSVEDLTQSQKQEKREKAKAERAKLDSNEYEGGSDMEGVRSYYGNGNGDSKD